MEEAPTSQTVSPDLLRITRMAKESPELRFRTLAHYITPELLRLAASRTRKDAAPGIDGQSGASYLKNLDGNVQDLWQRLREGRYRCSVSIPLQTVTSPIFSPTNGSILIRKDSSSPQKSTVWKNSCGTHRP